MNSYTDWITQNSIEVLVILVVSLAFYSVGSAVIVRIVRKTIEATAKRQGAHRKDIEKRQKTLAVLFRNIWRALAIAGGTLAIFTTIFPETSLAPLFASAGVVGVALGFGAQSLVKDFLSGIFIISENQYRVGDIIEIDGASGTVERIGTRSTVLRCKS